MVAVGEAVEEGQVEVLGEKRWQLGLARRVSGKIGHDLRVRLGATLVPARTEAVDLEMRQLFMARYTRGIRGEGFRCWTALRARGIVTSGQRNSCTWSWNSRSREEKVATPGLVEEEICCYKKNRRKPAIACYPKINSYPLLRRGNSVVLFCVGRQGRSSVFRWVKDSLATRWHVPNREWVGWESRNQKSRLDRGRDEAKICQEKPWDEMEAAWKVVREAERRRGRRKVCEGMRCGRRGDLGAPA